MRLETLPPPTLDQFLHPSYPRPVRRHLRRQISPPLIRCPHIAQHDIQHTLVGPTRLPQLGRRNNHSLLINLGRHRHRSRRHPSHIRVVRAIGRETYQLLFSTDPRVNRRDQRNIRQMRPTQKRIVHPDHIAHLKTLEHPYRGHHRVRHRP